ncbi:MAG: hypothetical protein JKY66_06970 [Spongiibacteraceae bacterium]|nr:hypothetical protein [Spongiibacteraceae bacterium]
MANQQPPNTPQEKLYNSGQSKPFSTRIKNSEYKPQTLEKEFKQELSHASHADDLEQRLLTIVNYLGRSDYSLIRLDAVDSVTDQQLIMPKTLLCSHRDKEAHRSGVLSQAKVASTRNRHLSMLYHFIAGTAFDIRILNKRQMHYVLITGADHYDYYISPTNTELESAYLSSTNTQNKQPTTNLHSKTAEALQILVNAIADIGNRQFPEIFLYSNNAKRVTIKAQSQKILNILALQDATLDQAAEQLNLTINSINKHLANAKKSLGTNTIAGTVWRAINEGLIDENYLGK